MRIFAYHNSYNGVSAYRVWNPMKYLKALGEDVVYAGQQLGAQARVVFDNVLEIVTEQADHQCVLSHDCRRRAVQIIDERELAEKHAFLEGCEEDVLAAHVAYDLGAAAQDDKERSSRVTFKEDVVTFLERAQFGMRNNSVKLRTRQVLEQDSVLQFVLELAELGFFKQEFKERLHCYHYTVSNI